MKYLLLLISALFFLISCKKDEVKPVSNPGIKEFDAVQVNKSNNMKLFAHYMPWFEDKSTSLNGQWGWHWTMNNQNPDETNIDGERQIASHYYPLIGPYASNDLDLIEYHLLLMKYSGIDGVLIDWYGTSDVYDYGTNRRNTESLISLLDKVGLKFAIVYEDAVVTPVAENTGSTETLIARNDMKYIEDNYFNLDSYIRIDGKPLLMVFGPRVFLEANDWDLIISAFSEKPVFMPLWGFGSNLGSTVGGEFIWVDQTDIDSKYSTKGSYPNFIGGAWPGFNDFYEEGNAGGGYFYIDSENGSLWQDLLNKAKSNNMKYLQLITWNDFGEGTIIEPTTQFQYKYLEMLQQFAQVDYNKTELEKITQQYFQRKMYGNDKDALKALDQAFYYWVSLQNKNAISVIDSLALLK